MLVLNLLADNSIRFTGEVQLVRDEIFSGELVSRIIGARSTAMIAFQLFVVSILLILMKISGRIYVRKQYLLLTILLLTLLLQVLSIIFSVLTDSGKINFIYVDGLPFTILSFFACLTISMSLEFKTKSLDDQIGMRRDLESVLSGLAKGVSSVDSDQFYLDMINELQKLSQAKMLYLCVYSKTTEQEWIDTKVVVYKNERIDNFSYSLRDIDKKLISYNQQLLIKRDLHKRFPEVELFRKMQAEAYINAPMTNEIGDLEGSIVLLFDHPIEENIRLSQTLDVFTSRAGAEMRRNRLESQLRKMAYFDYQTQLPNLTRMHELINEQYSHNNIVKQQSILIVLDLNKFTEVNRQYGFDVAEHTIKVLGQRFKDFANQNVVVGRSGGDEFAVLIRHAQGDLEIALQQYWQQISDIVRQAIEIDGREVNLNCTAGAVVFPQTNGRHIEVVRCAEIALGQAKQDKSRMCLFDVSILEDIDRKLMLEKLLENALQTGKELFAVYQPKVDSSGKLIGAEALARWLNGDAGFVSPDEFIPLAENAGFIDNLGFWMVHTVCAQLNEWRDNGFEMPGRVAINVSALQLAKNDFVGELLSIVSSHNIAPSKIELELTETGLLTDVNACISKLIDLQKAGFTVALDDFGTGYSSLSYLKDLPLDVLKIDRSFVKNLGSNKTAELARSIIAIGKHMSMLIVAEGVEEVSQVNILKEMGCTIFQGYYFSRPIDADAFLEWAMLEDDKHNTAVQ